MGTWSSLGWAGAQQGASLQTCESLQTRDLPAVLPPEQPEVALIAWGRSFMQLQAQNIYCLPMLALSPPPPSSPFASFPHPH